MRTCAWGRAADPGQPSTHPIRKGDSVMRSNRVSVLALTATALLSTSALASHGRLTPLPSHPAPQFKADPGKAIFHAPKNNQSGTWTPLTHSFPGAELPDTTLRLNDGPVLEHDGCTPDWSKLAPA